MILGTLVIIVVGILVVNYLRDNKGLLPGKSGVSINQTETKTHTVTAKDTLWSISQKYYGTGYRWVEIAKANSLPNPNKIEVGQTLNLPQMEVVTPPEAVTPTKGKISIPDTSYTVVKGDHLWKIAVRAYGDGYKWVNIARANNLKNPNIIFVGTVLTLPR